MNNFEKIKKMDKKKLAKFLADINGGGSVRYEKFLKWLNEKAED